MVRPYIVVVLHPLVRAGARHVAGDACAVVLIGRQAEDLEALAGDLGATVLVAVGSTGCPLACGSKGVVGGDAHLSALGHGLLVPLDLHGCHHGLAGIAEAARRTMVENIPLTVDLLQRAVGVVGCVGGGNLRAVLVEHHTAAIDEHTAGTPGAERRVAIGIAQGAVGVAEAILLAAIAREHHHILVADLTDAAGLEEVEVEGVLAFVERLVLASLLVEETAVGAAGGDEGVNEFRSRTLAVHGGLVQLAGRGVLEAVEHIGPEALVVVGVFLVRDVLHKDAGVEVDEGAINADTAVGCQVDRREGAVGAVALADRRHTAPSAAVGIEPIGFLARRLVLDFHEVGGIHGVPLAINEMREDGAFVAPLCEVLDGCRPHADVGTAVGGVGHVVRADDVSTQFSRVVRVFKDARFAVRKVFPKGEIRVLGVHNKNCQQRGCEGNKCAGFHCD